MSEASSEPVSKWNKNKGRQRKRQFKGDDEHISEEKKRTRNDNLDYLVGEGSNMAPMNLPLALPLVYEEENGKLQLDESVVQRCFLNSEVSEYPLGIICVIGERRKGKSTLLNYILRALHCMERQQPVSLGPDNEPLTGFEWRNSADSVTKGIMIWSKPFILERNGNKMAVFVLDTEGSLDIANNRETCLKMSALSMLLSSYLIFNVSGHLNTTEADYLELYLNVSKEIRGSSSLQNLQQLDFLVRDWQDPDNCGREAARTYLQHECEKQRQQGGSNYSHLLDTLSDPSVRGFLLPHPGNRFLRLRQGKLADMDEDFREHLTTYIFGIVKEIWNHQKTDIGGQKVTCARVGEALKEFVSMLQNIPCSFDSPLQMKIALENQKFKNNHLQKFQDFVDQQTLQYDYKSLKVKLSDMERKISDKVKVVMETFKCILKGNNSEAKKKLLDEMESELREKQKSFWATYSKNYSELENQYLKEKKDFKDKELKSFKEFLEQKNSVSPGKLFRVKPTKMETIVSDKVTAVSKAYEGILIGDNDLEKWSLVSEMKSEMTKKQIDFITKYTKRYNKYKACALVAGAAVGVATGGAVIALATKAACVMASTAAGYATIAAGGAAAEVLAVTSVTVADHVTDPKDDKDKKD